MDAGLKFSYVTTDNIAGYFNIVNDIKTVDIKKTNRFQYDENVNAAYINFSKTIKKCGVQLGVRVENTNYSGHQFGNEFRTDMDSTFKKSYTNAFPTVYVSYNDGKGNFTEMKELIEDFGYETGWTEEKTERYVANLFL